EHLEVSEIQQIHDEYDIEVRSETPEIRKRRLGQIISELGSISEGDSDAGKFEEWCLQVLRIVFATTLVNIEHHPNKNLTQRRDVVGRNNRNSEIWRWILEDYSHSLIESEVKHYYNDQ